MAMGVDRYLDYKQENYWEQLSDMDGVIDTLGPAEFDHELAVLKKGGRLVSLRTGPNKAFAEARQFPGWKKQLFALAGRKYDKAPKSRGRNTGLSLSVLTVHSSGKLPRWWNSSRYARLWMTVPLPWSRRMRPCSWWQRDRSTAK